MVVRITCNISCNGGKHDSLDSKYNAGSIVIYTEYYVSYRWLPDFQLSHTFFRVFAKKSGTIPMLELEK
jgi:hypothetical protein